MSAGEERALRRRIKSVQATKKITRAMELIAASQIARAQGRMTSFRPYLGAMVALASKTAREAAGADDRMLNAPAGLRRAGIIVLAADRGLCGGYNSAVLRAADRLIADHRARQVDSVVVAVGKKAAGFFRYRRLPVAASFTGVTARPSFEDAGRIAEAVRVPFLAGDLDVVQVVSTRFVTAALQRAELTNMFPISPILPSSAISQAALGSGGDFPAAARGGYGYTEFEPTAKDLLEKVLSWYVDAYVFGALLEASASEHMARQRAMAAATENADELIKTLTRTMNRVRQDAITTEIVEVVSGAEALRSDGDDTAGAEMLVEQLAPGL